VARHALIEIMNDGMLVLDAKDRIVDINPAARKLFGVHAVSPIGQHVELLLGMWPEILACWREDQECHNDLEVAGRYFDLHATPLRDHNDRFSGRLIVFRDITSHKQHMLEIQALQKELREQAIRDALTGLFNRRYLEETLERELARARRESTTVSVIMMDIDFFKWFNDTLGHKAGDVMLRALGEMLKTQTRTGDVACRFGGEEFAVVLPGAPLTIAQQRAEQLRAAFEHMRVRYEDMELHATLSAGVAAFPTHGASGDVVLNAADQALYVAKRSGRNRVAVWQGWTEEVGT